MNTRNEIAANLLVCALEGGSNYWIEKFKFCDVDRDKPAKIPYLEGLELWKEDKAVLNLKEDGGTDYDLTAYEILARGEEVAKEMNITLEELHESHDADDADRILQLACFGELVYG